MGGGYWGTWVVLWCGSVLGEVSFFFCSLFLDLVADWVMLLFIIICVT